MNIDQLNTISNKISNNLQSVHFLFDGPTGNIEAILDVPMVENTQRAFAIVCHPHPLHGGSMNNKVTHFIAKALNEAGVPALRFNFRGVGQSQGAHDNAAGEKKDLLAAIDVMQKLFPESSLWLAGFSFGAYIALSMTYISNADKLITVAPAVHLYDFNDVDLPDCDWLFIQGDNDEIVPSEDAIKWARNLASPPEIAILNNAGHFFHGRLNNLRDIIVNNINQSAQK